MTSNCVSTTIIPLRKSPPLRRTPISTSLTLTLPTILIPSSIRAIVVHPTQPFVLTASDDMTIKLWSWEKDWKCVQVFEGHSHYVMGLAINPKDTNTFASACLDRTVKIWNLGSGHANYTVSLTLLLPIYIY